MNEESKTIQGASGSAKSRGASPQKVERGESKGGEGKGEIETPEDKLAAIDEILTPFKLTPEVNAAAIEIGQLLSKAQRRNPRRVRWLVANARARAYRNS